VTGLGLASVEASWAAIFLVGLLWHLVADFFIQNDWMARNKSMPVIYSLRRLSRPPQPLEEFIEETRSTEWGPPPMKLQLDGIDRKLNLAGVVHAWIHAVGYCLIFGVWLGLALGVTHFFVDLRWPLEWWGRVFRQSGDNESFKMWRDQVAHFVLLAVAAGVAVS
jgi:hypothetical protein